MNGKGNAAGKSTAEQDEQELMNPIPTNPRCDVCGKQIFCGGSQTFLPASRSVVLRCNYCSENKLRIVKKEGKFGFLNRKERRAKAKELRRK